MSGGGHYPSTKSNNGIMDDDDGRTRNAKAQRRHREKRKAHLKTLEESVSLLTNQLEDARRQLSSAAYANRMSTGGGGPPLSPGGSKDYVALQQENTYLREENAELRRQLYSYSVNRHYPPVDGDVKGEAYGTYGQSGQQAGGQLASPREGSNGGRDGQVPSNNDFTPHTRGSRSRVMSSSSAPTASPYIPPTSAFPTDPRAHALGQSSGQQLDRYPPVRYDNIYGGASGSGSAGGSGGGGGGSGNGGGAGGGTSSATHSPNTSNAPAPHGLPRSGLGYDHLDMYSNRDENWGPDAGPPPFQGSVYPVPYGDGPSDEWRGEGHSH